MEIKESEINYHSHAYATCPYCDADQMVEMHESTEKCMFCGKEFKYSIMRNKLWCDMKTDEEKIKFLQSGRAVETGIIAPEIVDYFVKLLGAMTYAQKLCRIYFDIASEALGEKKVRELRDTAIGI